VYEALGAGALDAVNTPTLGARGALDGAAELVRRIHLVARVQAAAAPAAASAGSATLVHDAGGHAQKSAKTSVFPLSPTMPARTTPRLVAIGASTGGPRAVASVLAAMPRPLPFAVVVVQHVSRDFVGGYAEWLAAETKRVVRLARAGERLVADDIVIAGEDRHLVAQPDGTLAYSDEPRELVHRPAVDELFASLARHAAPGVAILLTGMGRDGAEGLALLRAAGWHTIAQDEKTSVVWGMPGAAHRMGAAVETLPLDAIGAAAAMRAHV
jgi:two-component system response regulator WspF